MKKISDLEHKFTLGALVFFCGNPLDLLLFGAGGDQTVDYSNSSSLGPLIILSIGLASFLLILFRRLPGRLRGKNQFSLLALGLVLFIVGLAACSMLWSADPNITLRRSLTLAATTTFATYFSLRFRYAEQLRFLAVTFFLVMLMSLGMGLLLPQYGQMQVVPHTGAWRGVFTHKNMLGGQMSMAAAFFLLTLNSRVLRWNPDRWAWNYRWNLMAWLGLWGSCFLIVVSRSSGALLNFLMLAIAIFLCKLLLLRSRAIPPLFTLLLSLMFLGTISFYTQLESILDVFGKDTSLTGRDELWLAVLQAVQERPWLGHGYEGFWRGIHSPASAIWKQVNWAPPHAHNGLLDLLIALGFAGGITFLIVLLINLIKSFLLIRINQTLESCWPLIFMLSFALKNATESHLIGNHISWILWVWVCTVPYFIRAESRLLIYLPEPPVIAPHSQKILI